MNKLLCDIQDQLVEPLMKEIEELYFEHLQSKELPKGQLKTPVTILREKANKDMQEFKDLVLAREELALMEKGFDLALRHLELLPNATSIIEDLKQAGERFSSRQEAPEEKIPFFYDTLQEMFGLSDETFDGFYSIAAKFYDEGKYDQALSIFSLLTNLSHLVFEPWLGQGICWKKRGNASEAMRSFAMASLVDYNHPLPHLHTADIYLSMGKKKLAAETLSHAISECDEGLMKEEKKFVQFLKSKIEEGKK